MGGGLLQLVAYGAQDVYLTGNPQITFFKVIYRRHTNFALESIEQTFNGQADFSRKVTCLISRNGDLIHRMYLRVELEDVTIPAPSGTVVNAFRWVDWIGEVLVKNVEIEIGGQRIDKHYSEWLHIWNELTQTAGHALGYANMVGQTPDLVELHKTTTTESVVVKGKVLYVPLQFFFNRNAGLALPLIALQYHEVKINIEFRDVADCYWAGTATAANGVWTTSKSLVTPKMKTASLYVDYIYLDTDERRRFAQSSHEYLIQQLQFTGEESITGPKYKAKLSFNHPVSELIWVVQKDSMLSNSDTYVSTETKPGKQWFNFTTEREGTVSDSISGGAAGGYSSGSSAFMTGGQNPVTLAKLQLNGHDRMAERDGRYFNLVQPYQHHENVPAAGINVYSFALKPEQHQPTGTCNMSRIDTATLTLDVPSDFSTNGAKARVFAVNYNVLRIMSGMGGLAYSN